MKPYDRKTVQPSTWVAITALPGAIMPAAIAASLLYLYVPQPGVAMLAMAASAAVTFAVAVAYKYLQVLSTQYEMSDDTLTLRYSLVRRVNQTIPLDSVREITISEGVGDRVFGTGTLILNMIDGNTIAIPAIPDPQPFRRELEQLVRQARRKVNN